MIISNLTIKQSGDLIEEKADKGRETGELKATTYLLITIFIMHLTTLANIVIFNGDWNGIVMAINTFLFVLAFGPVLPLKRKKIIHD